MKTVLSPECVKELVEQIVSSIVQLTPNDVMTTYEAAEYLRLSRQFLEICRVKGGGPEFVKLSRAVRYRRVDLDRWVEQHIQRNTATTKARVHECALCLPIKASV